MKQRLLSEKIKTGRLNYLVNGFMFIQEMLAKNLYLSTFTYIFPKPRYFDIISNFFLFRSLRSNYKNFDVVYVNNWENFFNIPSKKKRKHQIWIAESHGFHMGIDLKKGMADSIGFSKFAGYVAGFFLSRVLRKKMQQFDIVYAAIPNILKDLQKVCPHATWLPNAVDFSVFYPRPKQKLEGNPVIFFPTRIHKMKTPEHAFYIFSQIVKTYPQAKLHLIRYPERMSQYGLYKEFLKKYERHIIWHPFFSKEELATMYSSADLVLGSFGKGLLSLVELEAIACKATVVSHDDYEFIKKPLSELPQFALELLSDSSLKKKYVAEGYAYVHKVHNEKAIVKQHLLDLKKVAELKSKRNNN